jgi:hypothetical protein
LQKSGVNNTNYEEEFQVAETFESTTFEHPETKELLNFTEYLFVVDHTKRPTGDRPGGTTTSVPGRSSVKKLQRDFNAGRDH